MDFACGITAGIVVREDEAKALLLLLIVRVFGGGRTVSRDPERRHSRPCAYIPPVQVPTNLCSLTSPSPRLLFCLAFTNGDLSIDRFCSAAAHTVATPTRVDLQVAARFERPIFTALTEAPAYQSVSVCPVTRYSAVIGMPPSIRISAYRCKPRCLSVSCAPTPRHHDELLRIVKH